MKTRDIEALVVTSVDRISLDRARLRQITDWLGQTGIHIITPQPSLDYVYHSGQQNLRATERFISMALHLLGIGRTSIVDCLRDGSPTYSHHPGDGPKRQPLLM